MKKYVIGFFIGALLMFSGQAMADSISKIGKKVQGEVTVKVNGVPLEAKGLIVDGQTTVPARAFADASGYDVSFENKEVLLTSKEAEPIVHNVPELEQEPQIGLDDIPAVEEPSQEPTLESIEELIVLQESKISKYEKMLKLQIADGSDTTILEADLAKMNKELDRLKALEVELEAKK